MMYINLESRIKIKLMKANTLGLQVYNINVK